MRIIHFYPSHSQTEGIHARRVCTEFRLGSFHTSCFQLLYSPNSGRERPRRDFKIKKINGL